MNQLIARIRCEAGQAVVLVAIAMTALVGMSALVIDGGSWYHAQRNLQTSADAAALAGAQNLPDQISAQAAALDYAARNYPGAPAPTVTFPSAGVIDVQASAAAPGILAGVLSAAFNTVNITAHAQAQVSVPLFLKDVAPVAVKSSAACAVSDPGCYGQTVTVNFDESQITSLIGLINLDCYSSSSSGCGSGSIGANDLGNEISCTPCYPGALPANQWYGVKTGESVGQIRAGFQAMVGQPLLFPVWDVADAANRSFHVIGWAAFVIDPGGVNWGSQTRRLTGHFTTFTATDLASGGTIGGATDFGVHVITLTQ